MREISPHPHCWPKFSFIEKTWHFSRKLHFFLYIYNKEWTPGVLKVIRQIKIFLLRLLTHSIKVVGKFLPIVPSPLLDTLVAVAQQQYGLCGITKKLRTLSLNFTETQINNSLCVDESNTRRSQSPLGRVTQLLSWDYRRNTLFR